MNVDAGVLRKSSDPHAQEHLSKEHPLKYRLLVAISTRCNDVDSQEQLIKSLFVMLTRQESSPEKETIHPDSPSQPLKVQSMSSRIDDGEGEATENSALLMWFATNLLA